MLQYVYHGRVTMINVMLLLVKVPCSYVSEWQHQVPFFCINITCYQRWILTWSIILANPNKQENEHINVKRQHKDEHVFALAKDRAVFKRSGVPYRVLLCEKESHTLPYDIDRITWRNHHTLMMHMFMHGKWKVLYYDHANKTSSRKVYLCSTCQDAGVMDRSYQWQYSTCLHCAFE